mmetsp:Transcript_36900/g.106247  ORF Transcript_36900/g.106247 Transcript_36900/m.106247 type:complete len:211 (+) Transcript_36900:1656-2288(+)
MFQVLLVQALPPLLLVGVHPLHVVNLADHLRLLLRHPLDDPLLLLQRLVEALLLLVLAADVILNIAQSLLVPLKRLLQLEQLLLQTLSAANLSLGFRPLRVQRVLHVRDFRFALDLLRLVLLHLLCQADVVLGQLAHLRIQLIARLLQLVPLRDQVVHRILLGDAQACALLNEMTEVGDLELQIVNGILGALLFLVGRLHHLPCSLDLLL